MHPRVLIVGTVPYNTKSTSRAFDAYFHYWEKENLAQMNLKEKCDAPECNPTGSRKARTEHEL